MFQNGEVSKAYCGVRATLFVAIVNNRAFKLINLLCPLVCVSPGNAFTGAPNEKYFNPAGTWAKAFVRRRPSLGSSSSSN